MRQSTDIKKSFLSRVKQSLRLVASTTTISMYFTVNNTEKNEKMDIAQAKAFVWLIDIDLTIYIDWLIHRVIDYNSPSMQEQTPFHIGLQDQLNDVPLTKDNCQIQEADTVSPEGYLLPFTDTYVSFIRVKFSRENCLK